MDKALLMLAAAELTQAAVSGFQTPVPSDQPKDNAELQKRDLCVWEVFRIYYSALVAAYADHQYWPDPPSAATAPPKPAAPVPSPGVAPLGNVAAVVGAVASGVQQAAQAVQKPAS